MRLGTFIWLLLTAGMIGGLFHMKYEVQEREAELHRIQREIVEHREAIDILRAEWSHLNDPGRLGRLNEAHLGLVPVEREQLLRLESPDEAPRARAEAEGIERVRLEQFTSRPGP